MISDKVKLFAHYCEEPELADKHSELEVELSCEHCGQLSITQAEATYLEEQGAGGGPRYIDICDCEEGKEDLLAAFEEAKDEFFAEGKRTTIRDGFYDVGGIERTFLDEFFAGNTHSEL